MLSKSLVQFSVDGWACVPSLLFTWHQTLVEVMKIMVTSLKRSQACTAAVWAPNPAAGPFVPAEDPHLRRRLPDPYRQGSCGVTAPFSWVLVHRVLCALQESFSVLSNVFPEKVSPGVMASGSFLGALLRPRHPLEEAVQGQEIHSPEELQGPRELCLLWGMMWFSSQTACNQFLTPQRTQREFPGRLVVTLSFQRRCGCDPWWRS